MKKLLKTEVVKKYKLPLEIKKEGEYFLASCPAWTDCYAQGKTIDDATAEIIAVASSLIELYQEEGLKIPLSECENSPLTSVNKISFDVPVFSFT